MDRVTRWCDHSFMAMLQSFDGTTIHYKDWGSGPALLFCHGNNVNSDFWQHQMVPLVARGFRCVAFDRRGHGRSEPAGTGYDFGTLGKDLAAVLETLDLSHCTLIGHSTGACDIAFYLHAAGASRVSRVVLTGPATPFLRRTDDNPHGIPSDVFDQWERDLISDQPRYYREAADAFFGENVSKDMVDYVLGMAMHSTLLGAVETLRSMRAFDLRPQMSAFTVPTLIVQGTNDAGPPEATVLATHRAIAQSRLVWFEGAHHALPITHFERFNEEIAAFCRE